MIEDIEGKRGKISTLSRIEQYPKWEQEKSDDRDPIGSEIPPPTHLFAN